MNKDNLYTYKWHTYKATKPKHIQCVDEDTMTVWDIPEYDDGFIIPNKGDRIWLGDKLYEVEFLTHNPENELLVIVIKHCGNYYKSPELPNITVTK